jgi:hypothetical protein
MVSNLRKFGGIVGGERKIQIYAFLECKVLEYNTKELLALVKENGKWRRRKENRFSSMDE